MNKDKSIKDLKERNRKLKYNLELTEIKLEASDRDKEKYKGMLVDAIKKLASYEFRVNKAIEYIEEYWNCDGTPIDEVLKILGGGEYEERESRED